MKTVVHIGLIAAIAAGSMYADSLALVASDSSFFVTGAQTALLATGKFKNVDIIDAGAGTPTLAALSGYTDVLAWTNLPAFDSVALGNVLADYYDLGGKHVTIATFALAAGGIDGRIATAPYVSLADTGNFANPSGILVATASSDPVFSNVNLAAVTYYHNRGFVNASLGTGATLLATDGAGINMIARSSNGVVDINLYPGAGAAFGGVDNNDVLYGLIANTFSSVPKGPAPLPLCSGTSLSATGGIAQIQLSWALAGADHYNLYRGAAAGGPYTFIGLTNATTPTYVDGTVLANTTYYYVMREANSTNTETCQSNEAQATDAGDAIPPTTTISAVPAANANGWNNSNVTITLSAADNAGGSGVQKINVVLTGAQTGSNVVTGSNATVTINTEGSTTLTYFSTDNAGNAEAAKTRVILLDKTPPVTAATVSPLPNASGWNNTDVTVSFTGSDTGSGVSSCTAPIKFTTNGAGQVAQGVCTDNAGNVSAPVSKTINIDKNLPIISGVPGAGSCVLWAPTNKLVQVATLTVSGADTFDVAGTSNQPPAPGQTDIVITGTGLQPRVIELRAQRSGNGNSRIYTLTATAATSAGKSITQTFTCTVPHDRGEDGDKGKDKDNDPGVRHSSGAE